MRCDVSLPLLTNLLLFQVKSRPKEVIYWLARLKEAETQVCSLIAYSLKLFPPLQIKLSVEHIEYRWCAEASACELVSSYKDTQEMLHMAQQHLEKK